MRKIYKSLEEDSYTVVDIPEQFFVVTDIKYNLDLGDIKKGVIEGVTGISGSANIVLGFMGVARDLIITMDGPELVSLNKISRIMYNNPHYLVSNNLEALFRIWEKSRGGRHGYVGVLQNLFDYMKVWMKRKGGIEYGDTYAGLYHDWDYGHPPYYDLDEVWEQATSKINNMNDFTKNFIKAMNAIPKNYTGKEEFNTLSYNQVYAMLEGALEVVAQIYSDEAEWILKENKLVLPKRTKFIIGIDHMEGFERWRKGELEPIEIQITYQYSIERWEQIQELMDIIVGKYETAWIDMQEFKKMQGKILAMEKDINLRAEKLLKEFPDLQIFM